MRHGTELHQVMMMKYYFSIIKSTNQHVFCSLGEPASLKLRTTLYTDINLVYERDAPAIYYRNSANLDSFQETDFFLNRQNRGSKS